MVVDFLSQSKHDQSMIGIDNVIQYLNATLSPENLGALMF